MSADGTPIGGYEDWPAHARGSDLWPAGSDRGAGLAELLGVRRLGARGVRTVDRRVVDGVEVSELVWSVGFGPDTAAWLLRPAGRTDPLPGVLALHCHGGVRSVGAEQLVDLGDRSRARARWLRDGYYDGRAPATDLARRGFAVLAHDTFSWGSRRFDLSRPTAKLARLIAAQEALWRAEGRDPGDDERFDVVSSLHEETIAKTAGILGQSMAGLVAADDLAALEVLASDPGTDPDRLGAFGFSGGGSRAILLAALDHRLRAAVVTCMMATFDSMVPDKIDPHSWLLHTPGLWRFAEWPALTGIARARWLVQYRSGDDLFTPDGMRRADAALRGLHAGRGENSYRGTFTAGPHGFGQAEQRQAWDFLAAEL